MQQRLEKAITLEFTIKQPDTALAVPKLNSSKMQIQRTGSNELRKIKEERKVKLKAACLPIRLS